MEWAGNPHVSYSLDGWIANAIILLYINMQCCPNQLCYFWSLGNKEAFCCWITYTWSLEYLSWNGKRNLMPVVPRNELDGFLLWVFCMLSNSKQMDNVVGEETALSTYILNNTRSLFFSLYRQLLCACRFIIHTRLPEQDVFVWRVFFKGVIMNFWRKLWNKFL